MPANALPHIGEVLRLNAHAFPDKVGARDLTRSLTFRQWNARACRLANALAGLGLAKGDRVAVLAYNAIEWLEIYAAVAKAGLIAVPVNFRLVGPEIRYIAENCEARAFIVQDELVARAEEVRGDLAIPERNYIVFGGTSRVAGYRAYEDLLSDAHDRQAEGRDPQPSRERAALALDRRRDGLWPQRHGAPRHADVPRQLALFL